MKAVVTFEDLSDDEQAGLELHLAEIKGHAPAGDPARDAKTMQEVYALQISSEVEGYAARVRSERVAAQSPIGEVFVQLPEGDREDLIQELVKRARANKIDVSALTATPGS